MLKSVVSKEYLDLQKEMMMFQEQWKQSIDPMAIKPNLDKASIKAGVPAAALTAIDFDISLFLQWIDELIIALIKRNPDLEGNLLGVRSLLNEETATRWIDEAFAFNQLYFTQFAMENSLEEWIPQFLAETALRPYLQLTAEILQSQINDAVPGSGCPVCGEPVRLAVLEGEGRKVLQCPRCHVHWNAKRLECSHCGNENHKTIQFLTVEGDAVSQIQVCEECKGYIKIIDTRQYIQKPSAALLDINSIHLDFIAQEQGYQAAGEKKQTN